MSLAASVSLVAEQLVFYAELLFLEVVNDVVVGVGSAFFVGNLGFEVCMLDLEGLKMWLCDHSQLSRLDVAVDAVCVGGTFRGTMLTPIGDRSK